MLHEMLDQPILAKLYRLIKNKRTSFSPVSSKFTNYYQEKDTDS